MLTLAPPCAAEPEIFFSENPSDVERAKQTCRGCWRLRACREDVAQDPPSYGVWAAIDFTPVPAETKPCCDCGEDKPVTDFYTCGGYRTGRCKPCANRLRAEYKAAEPKAGPSAATLRRRAEIDARQLRAAQLRAAGMSFAAIGRTLGITHVSAMRAVQRAHAKGLIETQEAVA